VEKEEEKMEFPEMLEEEEEEEEEDWITAARLEILEYLLRRYGNLRVKDLAEILGCKPAVIQPLLKRLEGWGRIKCLKVGRSSVWVINERFPDTIYY